MGKSILTYKLFESESEDILDELKDNLANIYDILGEAKIDKKLYDDKNFIYVFTWNLNLKLSDFNDITKIVEFSDIMKEIVDISATKERMSNFDFEVSITDKISVRVLPKSEKSDAYKFIIGQEWREVKINKVQIIKFFRDRGNSILDIKVDDDENSDVSGVNIKLSNNNSMDEFVSMFNLEAESAYDNGDIKNGGINRDIFAESRNGYIRIDTNDEKTYITAL